MPTFKVALYSPGADKPSQLHEVWAKTVQEAAEQATQMRLTMKGVPDRLRAVAWPREAPEDKYEFYEPMVRRK